MAETTAQPVFPEKQKALVPGHYMRKATLVWELRNEKGMIVSKGSWTGPDGVKTPMLEVRAGEVVHFEFNKIGIGFVAWDAEWADGRHLAEAVLIDSVKLEKL
jgi:hypothetical protein